MVRVVGAHHITYMISNSTSNIITARIAGINPPNSSSRMTPFKNNNLQPGIEQMRRRHDTTNPGAYHGDAADLRARHLE
jgi:hypothetical protein